MSSKMSIKLGDKFFFQDEKSCEEVQVIYLQSAGACRVKVIDKNSKRYGMRFDISKEVANEAKAASLITFEVAR